jgi:hypothetical protein
MQPNEQIRAVVLGTDIGNLNFRNRASVLFQRVYSDFSHQHSARLISNLPPRAEPHKSVPQPKLVPLPL